jgi:SpoVK/Ycf46/Vps4 family AAA+-type ATPase
MASWFATVSEWFLGGASGAAPGLVAAPAPLPPPPPSPPPAALSSNSSSGGAASRSNAGSGGASTQAVLQNLVIELVSMSASYALLFLGLRYFMREMDPMRKQKDQAKASRQRLVDKLVANGRRPFAMDDYETIIASDLIYPEDLDVDFSMIGGLDHVKQEVFDIVALPLRRPDLFSGRSALLAPPKGVLLFGPPGTGKTMMAKAIAKESGAAFINLQMSTTMNKWFGESQKLVRATFSLAWKLAPCVIFIDEIDSFLRERTSEDHAAQGNMKAEFMALWDGLLSNDIQRAGRAYGVIVVGATNRPWDVDQAILRRMPRTFKLSLPDERQRLDILRIFLRGEPLDPELERALPALAASLDGYSGSDLKELCQAAAMLPFREFAAKCRADAVPAPGEGEQLRKLRLADFRLAAQDVRATGQAAYEYHEEAVQPGLSQQQQQQQAQLNQQQAAALMQALVAAAKAQQQQQQLLPQQQARNATGGKKSKKDDGVD